LVGLVDNKFPTTNLFQRFVKMRTLHLLHQKVYLPSSWRF